MPKANKSPKARNEEIRDTVTQQVGKLLKLHEHEYMSALEESETRKIKVTFPITFDFSESTAKSEVDFRFQVVHKDKMTAEYGDPDQEPLGDLPEEAKNDRAIPAKNGRASKRNRAAGKEAAAGETGA